MRNTSADPSLSKSPKKEQESKKGADIFCDVLQSEGVETMFGYPGGVVLPLFDSLCNSPINFVLSRHEQGATHMADSYARVTGKVGVVLVTSGPGACNTVTGLATAYMDSIPLVVFTGQVRTPLIGNDAFQEADITGITRPVTKHNCIVKDANELARIVREAFHIARTGRPGPVVVDLPVDVSAAMVAVGNNSDEIDLPGYRVRSEGHLRQIKRAAEAINDSGSFREETVNPKGILVVRQETLNDKMPTVYQLPLASVHSMLLAEQFKIRPRDIVYVTATPSIRWNRVLAQLIPSLTLVNTVSNLSR